MISAPILVQSTCFFFELGTNPIRHLQNSSPVIRNSDAQPRIPLLYLPVAATLTLHKCIWIPHKKRNPKKFLTRPFVLLLSGTTLRLRPGETGLRNRPQANLSREDRCKKKKKKPGRVRGKRRKAPT